jgi:hypothetical protein
MYFSGFYTSLGSLPPSHLFIPGLYNLQTSPIFPDLYLSGLYAYLIGLYPSLASIHLWYLYSPGLQTSLASMSPWLLNLPGLYTSRPLYLRGLFTSLNSIPTGLYNSMAYIRP